MSATLRVSAVEVIQKEERYTFLSAGVLADS
jgi:hypothetical protein